jgi:hypothetical protein
MKLRKWVKNKNEFNLNFSEYDTSTQEKIKERDINVKR